MKLSPQESQEQREQFVTALSSGDWQSILNQFVTVLAQRDKLYIAASALCLSVCDENEVEAELMLSLMLNEVAEKASPFIDPPTVLRDEKNNEPVAWEVKSEDSGIIVFSTTDKDAAILGAKELSSDGAESVEVVRSPIYDEYASVGYVPAKVLYDSSWYFRCWHCEQKVSLSDEEDKEGNPLNPVFEERRVFCGEKCQNNFHSSALRCKNVREEATQYLMELLPGIKIKSYQGGLVDPLQVRFSFPGGNHPVEWSKGHDGDVFLVKVVDVETWEAYRLAVKTFRSSNEESQSS